jgi:ATP-binding cassette subfamily B protein
MSIADNIRYGRPDATDDEIAAAAEAAGLGPAIERLPEGLETEVAERGASLSGGERQRVAIARALAREAPLLLLDEPTTGLDAATKRGVVTALLALLEGRTALIVTHDLELARRADSIVVLADGRIADEGTYDELMQTSEAFRELARSLAQEVAP